MFLIMKFRPLRPESWVVRDCLALKWLKPGLRDKIFPFLVIFNLLEYDLFVFIYFLYNFLLYNFITYFALSIIVNRPFGPLWYGSEILYSSVTR